MEDLTIEELELKRNEIYDQLGQINKIIQNKYKEQFILTVREGTYWKGYDGHYYHVTKVEANEHEMKLYGDRFIFDNTDPILGSLVPFNDKYYYDDFTLECISKEEYDTQYEKLTKALNYINSL